MTQGSLALWSLRCYSFTAGPEPGVSGFKEEDVDILHLGEDEDRNALFQTAPVGFFFRRGWIVCQRQA